MDYICIKCRTKFRLWSPFCPSCNMKFGLVSSIKDEKEESDSLWIRASEAKEDDVERLDTGLASLNDVFGGGLALPSVILIGGNPGIGKSTLLLGLVGANAKDSLYVTSEEAAKSIGVRAQRLGLKNIDDIRITNTISVERAQNAIKASRAKIVIVDSLQGLRNISEEEEIAYLKAKMAGKPVKRLKHTQTSVLGMALDIIQMAHKLTISIVLVNHMNKQGDISGVKEIEHMVDVSAFFTGDPNGFIRELSCRKNRFGGTAGKVAKLLMTPRGILEATEENMELYAKVEIKKNVDSRKERKLHRQKEQDQGSSSPRSDMQDTGMTHLRLDDTAPTAPR